MCSIWGTIIFYSPMRSLYMVQWHHILCTVILKFEIGFTRYKFPPHILMLQL
jgi:hypothetical protein